MITVYDVLESGWISYDTKVTIILYEEKAGKSCTVAHGTCRQNQIKAYEDYQVDHFFYNADHDRLAIAVIGDLII